MIQYYRKNSSVIGVDVENKISINMTLSPVMIQYSIIKGEHITTMLKRIESTPDLELITEEVANQMREAILKLL